MGKGSPNQPLTSTATSTLGVLMTTWSTASLLHPAGSRAGCTTCNICARTRSSAWRPRPHSRPENPYQPARQWGRLEASSVNPSGRSHLAGHGLAPVKATGQSFGGGDAVVQQHRGASQHRSTNNLRLLLRPLCLHCANRRSIERRHKPLGRNIGVHPMDCRRSEVLSAGTPQSADVRTAECQNVIYWEIPSPSIKNVIYRIGKSRDARGRRARKPPPTHAARARHG
jgi:hypothetical protein